MCICFRNHGSVAAPDAASSPSEAAVAHRLLRSLPSCWRTHSLSIPVSRSLSQLHGVHTRPVVPGREEDSSRHAQLPPQSRGPRSRLVAQQHLRRPAQGQQHAPGVLGSGAGGHRAEMGRQVRDSASFITSAAKSYLRRHCLQNPHADPELRKETLAGGTDVGHF